MSSFFRINEHIVDSQYIREYPGATLNSQEEPLKLSVKQYTPLDNEGSGIGDVTIIAAHGNGFPKVIVQRRKASPKEVRGATGADRCIRSCTSHCGKIYIVDKRLMVSRSEAYGLQT